MNDVKIISMYLPQFHRVEENDLWWGEGFTEWTTVKNAESLFGGHEQPKIPLNKNYYNLLDQDTLRWQAELMHTYGVDAQCMYHYWFKDGRKILEKPAELLLSNPDINMPFCFCWANETWARTWSLAGNKNSWAPAFESKETDLGDGILLEQEYGEEDDWKKHFEYLLPFFCDERYVKIGGKPLFVIYKSSLVFCLEEMAEKWNKWARNAGLPGIYLMGANVNQKNIPCLNKVLYHEPSCTLGAKYSVGRGLCLDYGTLCRNSLLYRGKHENCAYGGFVGFDDTPRRGRGGLAVVDSTPALFRNYLMALISKNVSCGNNLIFLNAWNEWGEGMYLEPDEKNGYDFLEALAYAKRHYLDEKEESNPFSIKTDDLLNEIDSLTQANALYHSYWRILDKWLSQKEQGKHLGDMLSQKSISEVAVYGMGILGKHLICELDSGNVCVKYGIDRKAHVMHEKIPIYMPEDDLPQAQAVIVAVPGIYEEVKKMMLEKGIKMVLSLEDVIWEW